jgi:uncharacterized membrane protein (DUF106 family)
MQVLSATWNWVKSHWQVILLAAVLIGGAIWVKRQQAAFADTLSKLDQTHQEEIQKITAARELEVAEHAKQVKEMQESITKVQSDYAESQAKLAQRQRLEQVEIVKKFGNDADGLANLLAQQQGFTVVKPPQ